MSWPTAPLREVATLEREGEIPSSLSADTPYLGLEHIDGDGTLHASATVGSAELKSTKFRFCAEHVLFGKLRPYLRKIARPTFDGVCSTDIIPIRPGKRLDRAFLYHFLRSPSMVSLAASRCSGANLPRLSPTQLEGFEVPIPPLDEQKRIAAILDAGDALRAKRRASVTQIDSLVQSVFSEMFGNPVTNPKGWDECHFADVIDRLEGGKNVLPSESPSDFRILKVSAVTYGEYRPEEAKWLPADFIPPDSYIVRSGDLLISRANTVDLIGATAYVWDTPARMVLPDKIWRFVWKNSAPVDSLYIFHMTRHKDFQRMIGSRASGTSGSMKNISKPKLLGLTIPLPPLPLQQEFAERVRRIRTQRAILVKQLSDLDSLFSSLQSRAFNGRLSASALSEPLTA